MSTKLIVQWMFVALLIGLAPGGTLTASAAAPDDSDDADVESAAPAPGPDPVLGSSAAAAAPAPAPWQRNPLAGLDVRLIGTAVVDGGASMAILQLPTETRFVREGDEIVPGMRLAKVWRNRIDVERAGVVQDMRARQSSGPPAGGEAIQADVASERIGESRVGNAIPANVAPERLREVYGRVGRSMYYSHYRQAQN
jgi:hypothetical protein